jgi:hypothetical protein
MKGQQPQSVAVKTGHCIYLIKIVSSNLNIKYYFPLKSTTIDFALDLIPPNMLKSCKRSVKT